MSVGGDHVTAVQANQPIPVDEAVERAHLEPVSVAQNPVYNPPFNNWSVHQPSPPHDHGMNGNEDLGQDIIIGGTQIHFGQQSVDEQDDEAEE